MTKLTAENLHTQMLAARSRHDLVKMYLGSAEPDAELYLTSKGSGLPPLKVSTDVLINLLETEAARAGHEYSELVRKVHAVNQLLSEE
ncbi:hypothetical protein OF001_U20249 [Pseudomonas sp. OF001]|uniref:hypothetical protein n=1 Tax=Pseudomonas sp. OF001 TaxID=2772300 RepID=UPI00191829AF|nr:hypothetical protein [Pseudomonas sp. OF001]CAD5377322.1 hypothetical protein OF001_U20249 [Pseudomonas sp. OF001]